MAVSKIFICGVLLMLGHLSFCTTDADDNEARERDKAVASSTSKPEEDLNTDSELVRRPFLFARPRRTTTVTSPRDTGALPPRQPRIRTTVSQRNDDGMRPEVTPENGLHRVAFNRGGNRQGISDITTPKDHASSQHDSLLSNIIKKLKRVFGKISRRYPPGHKMFKNTSDVVQRFSSKKTRLLMDLQKCRVQGSPAFNLSSISEPDVRRILNDLENTPGNIKDKLISEGGLQTLSSDDLRKMPVSLLPALTERKITEFNGLTGDKLRILCNRLMATGSSPWCLLSAVESGINCLGGSTQTFRMNSTNELRQDQPFRAPGYSVSKVMMTYAREAQAPDTWNKNTFIDLTKRLSSAMTAEDLSKVPEEILRQRYTWVKSQNKVLSQKI